MIVERCNRSARARDVAIVEKKDARTRCEPLGKCHDKASKVGFGNVRAQKAGQRRIEWIKLAAQCITIRWFKARISQVLPARDIQHGLMDVHAHDFWCIRASSMWRSGRS